VELRRLAVQGDPYGCGQGFVDIKFTVPFQYKPLVLRGNFKIAGNKNCSMTIVVILYEEKKHKNKL